MADPLPRQLNAQEFIRWAMDQPEGQRYELASGRIIAMAPERNRHNLTKVEALLALRSACREGNLDCTVLGDGATVIVDESTVYEPDVTVQCGHPIDLDATTADHPTILVEVLSPSTGGVDTGRKLADYFRIESVQHYLIVDPDRLRVIHHSREGDRIATKITATGSIAMDPPGISVAVNDLFPRG